MSEVSVLAFGMVFDGLAKRGIPAERLVDGLAVRLEDLRGFRKRIDWDVFVQLSERLEELLGGPAGLFDLGHDQFHASSTFGFMRQVARVFRRPRDLYWMGTTWFGRTIFSVLEADFRDLPDQRIQEVVRIPARYRDCPQLFHVMHGSLTAAPQLLRFDDARVEMELQPRQATYLITPPERGRFPRRGIARLTSRFAAWDLIDVMSKQQDELKESLVEMGAARAAAAGQLAGIGAIGFELCRCAEMDELARALPDVFAKHLPDWRIAIWLRPLDGGEPELIHKAVGVTGSPLHDFTLRTGRGVVGRMQAWAAPGDTPLRGAALLEGLVPWLAMALEGARSHAALRAAAIGPLC